MEARDKYIVQQYVEAERSMSDIVKETGLHFYKVKEIIKASGVHIRSKKEAQAIRNRTSMTQCPKFKKRLLHLYLVEKRGVRECSEILGCTCGWVSVLLEAWGVETRPYTSRRKNISHKAVIKAYTEDMLSLKMVGRRFKTSETTIVYILEKNGVPRRTISEAKKVAWERRKKAIEAAMEQDTAIRDAVEGKTLEDKVNAMRKQGMYVQDIFEALKAEFPDIEMAEVYEIVRA